MSYPDDLPPQNRHPVPAKTDPAQAHPIPTSQPSRIFTALLSDLRSSARRLARSGEDADDLVQDTLLRVWSRMAMAEHGGSDAAPVEDLRAYAFATMRHRAFRRAPTSRPAPAEGVEPAAPRGSDATARLGCAEALAALADLPPDQQDLLRLRAMEGLSYAQIARRTGLPLGTVTSRLARGRAALRLALDLPPGAPVAELLGGHDS